MRGERIAAPIFALLIVFSGAGASIAPGASPVGTAEAQLGDGSGGACEGSDWFLTFISGTILTTDCKTAGDVSDEWNETDAIETRTQIHSQAGQLGAGNEQFLTAMDNSLLESDTIAFSKGEAAAVEVLANGGTVSEAQQAANESIADYYAVKQANLLDRWNVNMQTLETLQARAQNTTGVSDGFIQTSDANNPNGRLAVVDAGDGPLAGVGYSEFNQIHDSRAITLTNGSIRNQYTFNFSFEFVYNDGTSRLEYTVPDSPSREPVGIETGDVQTTFSTNWNDEYAFDRIRVAPTDNLSSTTPIVLSDFANQWSAIDSAKQSTQEEAAVYVEESLGPAVQNGELNATSYVSPATIAQEYAQEYGNDSSYIRATAMGAFSGMETPDLNNTGSMRITHDGTTYEGLLLSQEAPSGGWQSGETYDPALLSGMQMFAVAGNNGSIVELNGRFTVDKVTGTNGEEISKATTVNVTYETANTSEDYAELQQQIRTLNEQIEERKAQATTGGSDVQTNDGLLAKIAAALGVGTGVVLVGAAAVVVVAARFYLPDQ